MKRFTNFLLSGLMLSAITVSAQPTMTQDWKNSTDIPAMANARFGFGYNGKVYTNDKSVTTVYAFDGTTTEAVVTHSATGIGIAADAAGNLILNNGFPNAASMTNISLWNHETGEISNITLTLPEGVAAARLDCIGRVVGDMFSEAGAAVFLAVNGKTTVVKIFIANGAQVVEKSKAIETGIAQDNLSIAIPLTDDPESDEFVVRKRSNKDFYYNNGSKWVAYTRVGNVSTGSGGDVFTLGGVLYTIEPAGATYYDGFQVVSRATNEVIATHEQEATTSNSQSYGTSLSAEVVDAKTVRVYQYQPGQFAAQYTIKFPVIYLVGNVEGAGGWDPTKGLEVVWTRPDVYEADFTAAPGNNFKIATAIGNWGIVDGNCFGFAADNSNAAVGENDIEANSGAIRIAEGGDYHITIDIANKKMTLTKKPLAVMPEKFYVIGDIAGNPWDPSYDGAVLLPTAEEGVYKTSEMVEFSNAVGNAYFSLSTAIGANDTDWATVNANQWGAAVGNTVLTNTGVDVKFYAKDETFGYFGSEHNYIVANGSYYIEVDVNAGSIVLSDPVTVGVGAVKAAKAKALGLNGEIRIINGTTASIYNAAGQAIVVNTASKTVNVAPGMYVVVVDGAAQKVVVR